MRKAVIAKQRQISFSSIAAVCAAVLSGAAHAATDAKIFFHGNEGAPDCQIFPMVSPVGEYPTPAIPTREGYEFVGWNTKEDGTGLWEPTEQVPAANNPHEFMVFGPGYLQFLDSENNNIYARVTHFKSGDLFVDEQDRLVDANGMVFLGVGGDPTGMANSSQIIFLHIPDVEEEAQSPHEVELKINAAGEVYCDHHYHGRILLGRIDFVEFEFPEDLEPAGGSYFKETPASGYKMEAQYTHFVKLNGKRDVNRVLECELDGPGFFQVMDDFGNIFYTRLGHFAISEEPILGLDGHLTDPNGHVVLGFVGDPTNVHGYQQRIRLEIPYIPDQPAAASLEHLGNYVNFTAGGPGPGGNITLAITHSNIPYATMSGGSLEVFMDLHRDYDGEEAVVMGGRPVADGTSVLNPEQAGAIYATPGTTVQEWHVWDWDFELARRVSHTFSADMNAAIAAGSFVVDPVFENMAVEFFIIPPGMGGGANSFCQTFLSGLGAVQLSGGTFEDYPTLDDITVRIDTDGVIIGTHPVLGELLLGRIDIAFFEFPGELEQIGEYYFMATETSGELAVYPLFGGEPDYELVFSGTKINWVWGDPVTGHHTYYAQWRKLAAQEAYPITKIELFNESTTDYIRLMVRIDLTKRLDLAVAIHGTPVLGNSFAELNSVDMPGYARQTPSTPGALKGAANDELEYVFKRPVQDNYFFRAESAE